MLWPQAGLWSAVPSPACLTPLLQVLSTSPPEISTVLVLDLGSEIAGIAMSLTTGSESHGLGHEDPHHEPGPELGAHQLGSTPGIPQTGTQEVGALGRDPI